MARLIAEQGVRGREDTSPTTRHIPVEQSRTQHIGTLLEQTRPLWVAALLPLFLFGEGRYATAGIVAVSALWAWAAWATGLWGRGLPASVCLLVLLMLAPITVLITPAADLSREHLGYFLAELLACFTVLTWARDARRALTLAWAFVATGLLLAISAPFLMDHPNGQAAGGQLPVAVESIQKNVLGGALAMLLPVTLGVCIGALQSGDFRSRVAAALSGISLLAMLAALVYSGSRGAIVASVVACAAMGMLAVKPLRWAVPLAACATATAGWLIGLDTALGQVFQGDTVGDFAVRVEIWSRALQLLRDFPLTGTGMGSFRVVAPTLYPYAISDPAKVHHAHNLYLQVGTDLGILGLVAFFGLVAALMVSGARSWTQGRTLGDMRGTWIVAGCVGALVAMLVHGLLDAVTWGTRAAPLAWGVLGLLGAMTTEATTNAKLHIPEEQNTHQTIT